jgi:hypothetical protein
MLQCLSAQILRGLLLRAIPGDWEQGMGGSWWSVPLVQQRRQGLPPDNCNCYLFRWLCTCAEGYNLSRQQQVVQQGGHAKGTVRPDRAAGGGSGAATGWAGGAACGLTRSSISAGLSAITLGAGGLSD